MAERNWCYLTLTNGDKVKVDKRDYERVSKRTWRLRVRSNGKEMVVTSIRLPEGVRTIPLGKFIMNPKEGYMVYPRRSLDFRRSNLLVCTLKERQRMLPKAKRKGNTSEFKGVSFMKASEKWRAVIEVDGDVISIGSFETEVQAALAYNKAAKKYYGELCYQNQVSRAKERRKG